MQIQPPPDTGSKTRRSCHAYRHDGRTTRPALHFPVAHCLGSARLRSNAGRSLPLPGVGVEIRGRCAVSAWRTIDSAPTEARILVWGGAAIRFGIKDKLGNWRATFHGPIKVKPTHWMPLPEPPK